MAVIKMLLLIGLLIFVHEFGHFIVARMFKLKVTRFCLGLPFGPAIWEKKIGDVTYGIHWFLFGGYVAFPDDEKDLKLPADSPELFKNAPIYQRACVLVAGVTANIITAYLLVLFCCFWWHQLPIGEYNLFAEGIIKNASISTIQSGLKAGDKIVSINGRKVVYPNELNKVAELSKKFDNKITNEQYKKVLGEVIKLNPELNEDSVLNKGDVIKLPKTILEDEIVLTEIEIFNLKDKKQYITLNEYQQKLRNNTFTKTNFKADEMIPLKDLVIGISDTASPINIVVQRDNKDITLNTIFTNDDGVIGVYPRFEEKTYYPKTIREVIGASNIYFVKNTKLMLWSLKLMFVGKVPMKQIKSVVAITKIGADVIKVSMMRGILLTALISLNLAILNLLPIPALDGGHLFFLLIEKIKGKPVDEKVIETCSVIFFTLLIALTILFVGNDIWTLWLEKLFN